MSTQHPTPGTEKKPEQTAKEPPPPPTVEEQAAKLTKVQHDEILREAVSWYLRNDFHKPVTRYVCEEFVGNIDKEARAASTISEHVATQHSSSEHTHNPLEANKPKR